MSRLRKGFLISLVMVAIIAIPVTVLFVAPMTYSGLIVRIVRSMTGLQAKFSGLEVDLFPPCIVTRDLEIFNPDTNSSLPMPAVNRFSASADADRFLNQTSNWWHSEASGVVLRLASHDNRDSNRDRPVEAIQAPKLRKNDSRAMALFSFESIEIKDLDLLRSDEQQTLRFHVSNLSLEKEADERLRVNVDASYQNQTLKASGTLVLSRARHSRKVDFHASVFGSELHIKGTVGGRWGTTASPRAKHRSRLTLGICQRWGCCWDRTSAPSCRSP